MTSNTQTSNRAFKHTHKHGDLTRLMLDYVQLENKEGRYPRYTDIEDYYKKITHGSNSFSHHLPNLRYAETQRPCGRWLKKNDPTQNTLYKGRYRVQYRKVHPRLDGLRKLRSRLNNWIHVNRKAGHTSHQSFYTVQDSLTELTKYINLCQSDASYTIYKHNLKEFNNLYNTYDVKANGPEAMRYKRKN